MTKVCLIDGSGYIFRAFYALPIMTAPDGTPVNAVYGFMTMFMRLLSNINCDYCIVLFDAKRQNFRNQIFADYKATRPELPEQLKPQFDLIHEAVQVLNLPYVLQEGYEADDLIATYAREAVEAGYEAVVVSGDKDLMQLIGKGVSYYDGMKDKFFTPEDVKEKFGVYPDKVVEVQALSGDKIDNVPGVPGIGPKTAAELVNAYGSVEGVLQHADDIKQVKRREIIKENAENARISLQLVTLNKNVPVERPLADFKCRAPHLDEVMAFVDRLGFKSIRPKLEKWVQTRCAALGGADVATVKTVVKPQTNYQNVTSRAQLEDLYKEIKHMQKVALQVMYDEQEVVGVSLSPAPYCSYYIEICNAPAVADLFALPTVSALERETVIKFLTAVLQDAEILKIAVDIKTQWHWLNKLCGQELNLFPYDDAAIMSYDLDSSEHEHTLPVLSDLFLDEKLPSLKADGKTKRIDFKAPEYENYRMAAADCVGRLHQLFKQRLFDERKNYVYEMLDRRLAAVLRQMETAGITVCEQKLRELDTLFASEMQTLETQIYALAGGEFNLGSPKQIGERLFGKMGLKGKKKTSEDQLFTLETVACLGACSLAPAMTVNDEVHAKMTPESAIALIDQIRAKEGENG